MEKRDVRTIYTVLGMDQGVSIVCALIFLASLTPLFLFGSLPDLVIFPVLGITAMYAFYRTRSSRGVLFIAMMGFIYGAIRYLQILGK